MKCRTKSDFKQVIKARSDVFTFGKHKGDSIETVLKDNPGYILWCSDEKLVKFPDEILDLAEAMDRETDEWMGEDVYDWMDEPF